MQPSTIFKSNRFRLFDIGSLCWRPAEFVVILVIAIHGRRCVSVTVLSVVIVPVLPPFQLGDNLLRTPEKDISLKISQQSPIQPYPAGLLLGNRGQLDLLLLDGGIAEVQETLCLLPGLLDGGERGADTEPGGPPVAVHPLCLH